MVAYDDKLNYRRSEQYHDPINSLKSFHAALSALRCSYASQRAAKSAVYRRSQTPAESEYSPLPAFRYGHDTRIRKYV